jgi:hypothetical protein
MSKSRQRDSVKKDRRSAVFLCVGALVLAGGLAGCVDSQNHPLLATLGAFVPGSGSDVSKVAAKVSYASIKFSAGHRSGLLILAEQSSGLTFWQSSQAETVVLRQGYLQSTSGLDSNLEMTQITGLADNAGQASPFAQDLASPVEYKVLRSWRGRDDRLHSGAAEATLSCAGRTRPVKLPLATLPLKKCVQSMSWNSGKHTKSIYWIDPKDNRIWAGDVVAWPGGPEYAWQVARPWW